MAIVRLSGLWSRIKSPARSRPNAMTTPPDAKVATLGGLPEELIEMIVCYLDDRASVCALRAVSHSLCHKSSHGHFFSFFRQTKLELSVDALTQVIPMYTTFGRHIEDLTVMCPDSRSAVARLDGPRDVEEREAITDLLVRCFACLDGSPGNRGLQSITFGVASQHEVRRQSRVKVWFLAAIFLQALKVSRLTAPALVLGQCPFPMNIIHKDLNLTEGASILKSVRDLKLSISNSDYVVPALDNVNAACSAESGTIISKFLEGASNLENLHLTWTRIRDPHLRHLWANYFEAEPLTFAKCLRSLASAPLQKLTLGGLHTTAAILCEFLSSTSARNIRFEGVHIHHSRSWTEVFAVLTRPENSFTEIYLDDLFDHNAIWFTMVFFEIPGAPKFRMGHGRTGPSTLHRCGTEVQNLIGWRFGAGWPRNDWDFYNWESEHHMRFGPQHRNDPCGCTGNAVYGL